MKILMPTYRLSRPQFFQYTLAYYGFVAVVSVIVVVTGGGGGWIGLLAQLVLFLLYLQYVVRPRLQDMSHTRWALTLLVPVVILPWWALLSPAFVVYFSIVCTMLTLLFFPGSRSDSLGGTKGVRKVVISGAEILGAPIILGVGLLTAVIFVGMASTCWFGGDAKAWGCSDWGNIGPLEAETAALQAAMDTMMAVNNITIVSANDNTTGGLGVNNWTALPKGPGASPLGGVYIREPNSLFYYCWDSKGFVYAQNKKDGVTAKPNDAEKQRPCKIPPTDST